MRTYQTVVVGTDGSDSSLRAVDRAGTIAARTNAKLFVVSAHLPTDEKGSWGRAPAPDRVSDRGVEDVLKDEAYKVHGSAPIYAILRAASARAKAAGAQNIEERPIVGAPIEALLDLAQEVNADLLVVGNVGLNSMAGRLLGSVPANVSRRAKSDVLIVHTT